jgi:hypothetical protein
VKLAIAVAVAILLSAVTARADQINDFNFSDVVIDNGGPMAQSVISGSFLWDVTTETISNVEVGVTGAALTAVDTQITASSLVYDLTGLFGSYEVYFDVIGQGVDSGWISAQRGQVGDSSDVYSSQFSVDDPPINPTSTPEPAGFALLATGLLGLTALRFRYAR